MEIDKNITRENIAQTLHDEFGLTKRDCLSFVNDILDIIIDGLNSEGYVKIHNFGSFKLKRKGSRIGRNPKTKEDVVIKERNVITFKASKGVINYINKSND